MIGDDDMCARDDIDKKNIETINRILTNYPKEVSLYISSLSRKTSYTKLVYARYVCKFIDYVQQELKYNIIKQSNYAKIKPMHIDAYMENIKYSDDGKEKSGTYRNAQLAAINGFFKFLVKNDMIKNNPCIDIENPKDNKEHEIITISDDDLDDIMYNIINGTGSEKARSTQEKWVNRDIAIVTLGISTGLRVSAIVGIDIDDVNLEEKYIYVTEKGNIRKKIYIGNKTAYVLNNWINDRKYMVNKNEKALFVCQGNHRISVRAVENRFKSISKSTGKKLTPHKMRATCATRLYEQTGDIYLVQQQLGHKNIENTRRYAKVSEDRKKEAALILDSIY